MEEVHDQNDSEVLGFWGGEHATLDEFADALAGLGKKDHDRIELIARKLATGTSLEAGDLVNSAIEGLLTPGRRHWHREETLIECVGRTMRSIVRDWWRRRQTVEIVTEADASFIEDDNGDEMGIIDRSRSEDPDQERVLIAREAIDEVRVALKDEKNTWEIALALANGDKPEDIRYAYELTETEYDSALKRIRRTLNKIRPPGERT